MAALATTSTERGQIGAQCGRSPFLVNCDREERKKYVHFLQEAERSNSRLIEKLEKELGKMYAYCKESGWTDVFKELEEYRKTLETEEYAEKNAFKMKLLKIRNGVEKFKSCKTLEPSPVVTEALKEQMSEVENSINILREEHRSCMMETVREERLCFKEITAFETKFENWSVVVKSNPKLPTALSAPTLKSKLQERDVPDEVKALDTFLQKTGGLYGGWEEYDHRDFVRTWRKHSGKTSYRKEAKLYLPGKNTEDIRHHENWYQKLLCLQERKKEAIQRWKTHKHLEHQNRIRMEKEEEMQKSKKRKKVKAHMNEIQIKKVADQLECWRKKKKEKEKNEENQRTENEILKKLEEMKKHHLQQKVKENIKEQLQLRRKVEEEQARTKKEAEEREMRERRKEAAKAIKCSNERDLHKVKQKLHEKLLKEKEEEERQKRNAASLKEKVDGHVTRDPSRLIRPTKGWQERMKDIGPSGGGRTLQMFHRAVPTWRKGL